MKRVVLTNLGFQRLQQELHRLKSQERPRIIKEIAEARSHGDLSENAEYHAAREQQGFVEGRIRQLDADLSIAEVIDPTSLNLADKVGFGAQVTLLDLDNDRRLRYQIVGDLEADISNNQISVSSPIAMALIGKSTGDDVDVDTPGGKRSYEIVEINYNCQ